MFEAKGGLKQVGVLQPSGQPGEQAPAKRVTHCAEVKFYAVRYGSEDGTAHTAVLMKAGDAWYMPPNAEPWSQSLKPLAPWLAKQLSDQITSQSAPTPKEDSVDVLAAEGK